MVMQITSNLELMPPEVDALVDTELVSKLVRERDEAGDYNYYTTVLTKRCGEDQHKDIFPTPSLN